MASKLVCDICGVECFGHGRYELRYKSLISNKKIDICNECISEIKIMKSRNIQLPIAGSAIGERLTGSGNNPRPARD